MKKEVLLILVLFLLVISGCEQEEAVCGNGKHETGEGYDNCCEDAGCPLGKICKNSVCTTNVGCGQCQYSESGICKDYTCCIDVDCDDNKINTTDRCKNGFTKQSKCNYTSAHECLNNSDCNDNNASTRDICTAGPIKICYYMEQDEFIDCGAFFIDTGSYNFFNLNYSNGTNYSYTVENEESLECFIEASEDCDLSEVLSTQTIDIFGTGLLVSTKSKIELKGETSGLCDINFKIEDYYAGVRDELIQYLLDQGYTTELVDEAIQNATDLGYNYTVGRESLCSIKKENFTQYLIKSKTGNFSYGVSCTGSINNVTCTYSGDYAIFNDCEGDYF